MIVYNSFHGLTECLSEVCILEKTTKLQVNSLLINERGLLNLTSPVGYHLVVVERQKGIPGSTITDRLIGRGQTKM